MGIFAGPGRIKADAVAFTFGGASRILIFGCKTLFFDRVNTHLRIDLNEKLYLRDLQATDLGRRLIAGSVLLIDEIGFEQFIFKKLAQRMESTEASLYRYFVNKHKLLVYLVSWHWAWLRYQIRFHTHYVPGTRERLRLILGILTQAHEADPATTQLDEATLYRIVVNEASKSYLTKDVDDDNR